MRHANARTVRTARGRAVIVFGRVLALSFVAVAGAQNAAALDSGVVIGRLARTPPANIAFVEVRFSELLNEPVVVSGTLFYEGVGALERRVEHPYREITTIRGESVRVRRAGEADRTFSLRRAAELRGFLTVMIGLLTGDGRFLERHFSIVPSGDESRWRLDLDPSDDRIRERLRAITIAGAASEAHCFVIDDTRGGASILLLGPKAAQPLPQPLSRDSLLESCAAE